MVLRRRQGSLAMVCDGPAQLEVLASIVGVDATWVARPVSSLKRKGPSALSGVSAHRMIEDFDRQFTREEQAHEHDGDRGG